MALDESITESTEALKVNIARILVVEDDEPTLIALSEALVDEGFFCRPFADPADALEYALNNDDYLAILTDIKMPGMTGLELVRKIRASSTPASEKPVIFASGNATREDIQTALRLGAREFLEKPINFDLLIDTLHELAEEARAEEDDTSANYAIDREAANLEMIQLLAHETRTPLNAVIGFSSLMLDPNLKYELDTVHALAQNIHEAGEELLKKVNLVLGTLAASVNAAPDLKPTLARQLITACLDRNDLRTAKQTHKIDVDDQMGLKLWRLDPKGAEEALEQVVLNAAEFSPDGSIIRITAREEQGSLLIEVADQGPGMTPQQRDRALSLFSKAEEAQVAIKGGMGLGLPFAKRKMVAQGGQLDVIAPDEGGTLVRFAFPSNVP